MSGVAQMTPVNRLAPGSLVDGPTRDARIAGSLAVVHDATVTAALRISYVGPTPHTLLRGVTFP
jgi:hypothetical protein